MDAKDTARVKISNSGLLVIFVLYVFLAKIEYISDKSKFFHIFMLFHEIIIEICECAVLFRRSFYTFVPEMSLTVKDYIQIYPLVPLAISLIVGIVMGEHFAVAYSALLTGMLAIVAVGVLFNNNRRLGDLMSLAYIAFFLLLGIFLVKHANEGQTFAETDAYETFHVIAISEQTEKDNGAWIEVKVADGRLRGHTVRLHIIYNIEESHQRELLGKCLWVRAKVRHPKSFTDNKFDYPLYLKSHGIVATATVYPNNWHVVEEHGYSLSPIDNLKIYFLSKRKIMVERLRSLGMEHQAFAVAAAMSLGDKSEVSRVTSNVYSLAGTSHVLALSGLHLSIVFGLFAVFGGRWRKSVVMVIVSVVAMWIYVFLAGLPVSMIRSAIMLSVSLLVGLSGRDSITLNTLSFSAIIIVLLNPFAIHDVGFQLSFAAVAFLGAFASRICNIIPMELLYNHRFLKWCWQMSVTSMVAQLGTTPLVAYHFGRLPLLFLPANFIAIPAATVMLYLSVAFFISLWLPWVSAAIGHLLSLTSSALNASMTFIAQLKYSSLAVENLGIVHVVCLYIVSIALLIILQYIQLFSSSKVRH